MDNVANHGCGPFFDKAKSNGQFIWDPADIRQRDVILWMLEDRSETRKPVGHISLIDNVVAPGEAGGAFTLNCAESNGSTGADPRLTARELKASKAADGSSSYVQGAAGKRYLLLGDDSKVIIIRMN